jgi:hypothetical protein
MTSKSKSEKCHTPNPEADPYMPPKLSDRQREVIHFWIPCRDENVLTGDARLKDSRNHAFCLRLRRGDAKKTATYRFIQRATICSVHLRRWSTFLLQMRLFNNVDRF